MTLPKNDILTYILMYFRQKSGPQRHPADPPLLLGFTAIAGHQG
jgi:hypothetical protein